MSSIQAPGMLTRLYDSAFAGLIGVVERDTVPDVVLRAGIRQLLAQRLRDLACNGEERAARLQAFVDELKNMPVAIHTAAANEQHYEVPSHYFLLALGKHLKYSCCHYARPGTSLEQAEEAMLAMTCERAGLADGQSVLELGCGWGSLSLFMAARYPGSAVTAVSNSRTQKELIDARARERGLTNLKVVTADVVDYDAGACAYDRVVSVEMFEHMKNYQTLLRRISGWLRPGGKLFVHIFVCRQLPYHFEVQGEDDWMARYFFSGGTMPSEDLLARFQDDLALQRQWYCNGRHYSRTLEDWLARQDAQRADIMPLFEKTYGSKQAAVTWWVRWRLFYLACSELFAYAGGETWGVGHYLFEKKQ